MPQAMLLMMPFVVGVLATVMGLTLVRGRPWLTAALVTR